MKRIALIILLAPVFVSVNTSWASPYDDNPVTLGETQSQAQVAVPSGKEIVPLTVQAPAPAAGAQSVGEIADSFYELENASLLLLSEVVNARKKGKNRTKEFSAAKNDLVKKGNAFKLLLGQASSVHVPQIHEIQSAYVPAGKLLSAFYVAATTVKGEIGQKEVERILLSHIRFSMEGSNFKETLFRFELTHASDAGAKTDKSGPK